ncbi:hypothetical protein LWI29_016317 [Acer saccharum]|uniref:Uncharacterized protein n=1 Tax=Acer saccharum TaxID=4024 RepID=A0AA39RV06_ACESA|nr:hypothetical protein LWI29_016317 [Acer saccharum]
MIERRKKKKKIESLVKTESGQRKYRLQRDSDVRFLLLGQTIVPEVYVDLVEKVARDVRDQPAVPPRRSPIPIRVPVAPSPPPFATELVPTTQQFRLRPEVPIWDGDNGIWDGNNDIQDTFIADEQERVVMPMIHIRRMVMRFMNREKFLAAICRHKHSGAKYRVESGAKSMAKSGAKSVAMWCIRTDM